MFFALFCGEDSGDSFFQMTVLAEFESVGPTAGRRGNSMRHVFEDDRLWPNKSLEPTAAPLMGLARLPFRATGSSGCGSALIR